MKDKPIYPNIQITDYTILFENESINYAATEFVTYVRILGQDNKWFLQNFNRTIKTNGVEHTSVEHLENKFDTLYHLINIIEINRACVIVSTNIVSAMSGVSVFTLDELQISDRDRFLRTNNTK